jgi:uncharacterized membrane protein (GlpM family)
MSAEDRTMLSTFLIGLLVKAAITAAVVITAGVIAEALGPFWGGLISALPIAAGPGYILLSIEHDAGFVAAAALSSYASTAAIMLFLIAIVRLAPSQPLWRVMGGGVLAWLVGVLAIRAFDWTPLSALALNIVATLPAIIVSRDAERRLGRIKLAPPLCWYDLPVRAMLVGLVVASVVMISRLLGPAATGALAVFPIALSSLCIIIHRRLGGPACAALVASAIRGMPGFGLALLTLHLAIGPLGLPLGLLAGLATSLTWAVGQMTVRRLRPVRLTA